MDKTLLKKHPINPKEIGRYLQKAKQELVDAKKILSISEDISFKTTYDAMIKISLALMMANGYRPRSQVGHHKTMIEFVAKMLRIKDKSIMKRFDQARKKRNLLVYQAQWVSLREAKEAINLAEKYFKAVIIVIEKKNPQKKLV